MSTLKMQESTPDDEVTQLRKQAANKDNSYATLENQLLKKNNDLTSVKELLNETLCKLRDEADRVLKLESELNRQSEDLRAERLTRQNLEASLTAVGSRLASEEKAARHLQMELDAYSSRISSQHEFEVKQLQHEKSTLEARVRALEAQAQASKSSQAPTRLPRPTTFSGAASTVSDARIATLQCDLSKVERELADAMHSLSTARQEALKVPRLQADMIAADNARMRAEKMVKTERDNAENLREKLQDREEELEYWRKTSNETSDIEDRLDEAIRERDGALQREEQSRRCEVAMKKQLEVLEEREAMLVMEREEALNELHQLQSAQPSDHKHDDSTLAELRTALAERDSALLNARGYAAELQQMYHDTLAACENAENHIKDLERQLQPSQQDPPPLIIISPPPSPFPSASAPFLARPDTGQMSAEDEAIVSRLLSAIERLRGERDALRRDLHFATIEHRVANDALRVKLDITEDEIRTLEEAAEKSKDELNNSAARYEDEIQMLRIELENLHRKFEHMDAESTSRSTQLATNDSEMHTLRASTLALEKDREQLITSCERSSLIATSSLVLIQHLRSGLDLVDSSKLELEKTHDVLLSSHSELEQELVEEVHRRDLATTACNRAEARLAEAIRARDEAVYDQGKLRDEVAASHAHVADVEKEVEERDARITGMHTELTELKLQISNLQCELSDARDELDNAEARHYTRQLSALSSVENGAAKVLKSQIEVLEQRVLRRTEQIGMLQHDTKRLETNMRVAEETIGELSAELETLGQERACLVEDCAQAREARDEAQRKVEELEVEVETLGKDRQDLEETKQMLQATQAEVATITASVEAMVYVVVGSMAKTRSSNAAFSQTIARLSIAERNVNEAQACRSRALAEADRLSSKLDSLVIVLSDKTVAADALAQELTTAKDEIQRLTVALESSRSEAQSRENDVTYQIRDLTTTVEELTGQLAEAQAHEGALSQKLVARLEESENQARLTQDVDHQLEQLNATVVELESTLAVAQASENTLSQELGAAVLKERELRAQLEQVEEEHRRAVQEAQGLSSAVSSLEQNLALERASHSDAITLAQRNFERDVSALMAQAEDNKKHLFSLQAEHTGVVHDLTNKLDMLKSHLAEAREGAASRESLNLELRRLESEHADELLVLRSQLDESTGQTDSLRAQLQTATDTIGELECDIKVSVERYDTVQTEIRGLELALAGARAQVDEHDASIHALQREKTALQIEQMRLEAELDRVTTKHQYVEQQAKRSDHEVTRLKSQVEHIRAEAVKFDEAAQTAEITLSFKTNQYEQKIAALQRELQKQQSHRQCQDSLAELHEKNEYLEEMLKMKSVEIEENDDRFIEALKEKKRLTSKVESLTRKVQGLQARISAATATASTSAAPPSLPISRPKTPPVIPPPVPSAGPSTRPPTRIPSSPAVALRTKTPEPMRRALVSNMAISEPSLPSSSQAMQQHSTMYPTPENAPTATRIDIHKPLETTPPNSRAGSTLSTPLSSGNRKRRAPDDFDSPVLMPAQAIVAPGGTTPRHLRRPTNEGKSGFTPTRNGTAAPLRPSIQSSPLRRSTVPLAESTNSPRENRPMGLGKPASVSKPPVRGWLSRARTPTTVGGGIRSTSTLGVRQ